MLDVENRIKENKMLSSFNFSTSTQVAFSSGYDQKKSVQVDVAIR